jgi:hypothetical protein
MTKIGVSALLCAGLMSASAATSAQANTYQLTLTDPTNSQFSGTGTLIITGAPGATNTSDEFCLNNSCGGGTLTSLVVTLNNGDVFSSSDSGASNPSATFDDGVLIALGLSDTNSAGGFQFQAPQSGALTYEFHKFSPNLQADGTIALATTPLPAALPLFAGGLGIVGFLARRKKQKALAAP